MLFMLKCLCGQTKRACICGFNIAVLSQYMDCVIVRHFAQADYGFTPSLKFWESVKILSSPRSGDIILLHRGTLCIHSQDNRAL